MNPKVLGGEVREVPEDIEKYFLEHPELLEKWNNLTELGRNDYLCWIETSKKEETRIKRKEQMYEEVIQGKKRPCCFPGDPLRRESAKKWYK